MRCSIVTILLLGCSFFSCEENENYAIKNQNDLDLLLKNDYFKISYNTADLAGSDCVENMFSFDNIEVIKLKQKDFDEIKSSLSSARLDPLQTSVTSNLSLEYKGFKYCLNHFGELSRNNRRLEVDKELVYLISAQSEYYNFFPQEQLEKNDSLISKFGLPMSYHADQLGDLALGVKDDVASNLKKRNVIITY